MNWEPSIQRIADHVVRIETPSSFGTGFLAHYSSNKLACGIATAAHVVTHADEWLQPIRIRNTQGVLLLSAEKRVIFTNGESDSAVIFFLKENLELPELPITLRPIGQPCGIGTEIGWVGYPVIDPDTLCFFSGTVSARKESQRSYNIDGVAINGVSGGPVFHLPTRDSKDMQIIGAISAYRPNMSQGQPLPGLAYANA